METTPLAKAVQVLGSQASLATAVGVTPQAVSNWVRTGVPVERCRAIETATARQVTVHDLRPDIFGPAPTLAPASEQPA